MRAALGVLAWAALGLRLSASHKEAETRAAAPNIDKVLTLLNNLMLQIDRDAAADDEDWGAFQQWFSGQDGAASEAVGGLNAKLQELAASLTDLRAHHLTTMAQHERLDAERVTAVSQLDQATAKRKEEHDAFVKEQLDFEQSITACARAVELLRAHYGEEQTLEKPQWLSLQSVLSTVKTAAQRHHKALSVLQQPAAPGSSLYDVYEPSGDEARGIVAQIEELGKQFESDKASSADQEHELLTAFQTLEAEKQQIIQGLEDQLAELKAVATTASEQIAEKGAAEQSAKVALSNEQAYLSAIRAQERDVAASYQQRKADREEERNKLREAQQLLSAAFLQLAARSARRPSPAARAAALLRQAASQQRSELLATAASAAAAPEAVQDVVQELQGLLDRIHEEHLHEVEHAEWCHKETTAANEKKQQHEGLSNEASSSLASSKDFAGAKAEELRETQEDIQEMDADWKQQGQLRQQLHADYVAQQRDNTDAINALGEAETMLKEHYALVQVRVRQTPIEDRPDAPTAQLGNSYSSVGGGVVGAIEALRQDFEKAAADAQKAEEQAVADYAAAEQRYNSSRGALVDASTQLTQQLQTAQSDQATFKENLASHQEAVASADAYLGDLRRSCASLVEHLPAREAQRTAERNAIQDAIAILRSA